MNDRQENETFIYAGFWWRFLAYLLDFFILSVGGGLLRIGPHESGDAVRNAPVGQMSGGPADHVATPWPIFGAIGLALLITGLVWSVLAIYFVLFECSHFRATPGKLVCGLIVVDLHGKRISFWRATARHFAKLLSILTLTIGFMMAGWTHRMQALHDKIAGCLVLKRVESPAAVAIPPA
jgi:uncharacterized RDD family membrane protein YckC